MKEYILIIYLSCVKAEILIIDNLRIQPKAIIDTHVERTLSNCIMRCRINPYCKEVGFGSTLLTDEITCYLLSENITVGLLSQRPTKGSIEVQVVKRKEKNDFGVDDSTKCAASCKNKPCHANAVCENTKESFSCTCICGYVGDGKQCTEFSPVVENKTMILIDEKCAIQRGHLLTTLPVGKEYMVEFDIFPTSFKTGWQNVIHFTASGNDDAHYADRLPAVWSDIITGDQLYVCSPVNGSSSCSKTGVIPRAEWSSVTIAQRRNSQGQYVYTIKINGNTVLSIVNGNARRFSDVKVYAGDPWYEPQVGYIRRFRVDLDNVAPGKHASQSTVYATQGATASIDENFATSSETLSQQAPHWWKIDLGKSMKIYMIRIFTFGKNGYGLSGGTLKIGMVDNVYDTLVLVLQGLPQKIGQNYAYEFTFQHGRIGRFIRVESNTSGYLEIREFEVYAV